MYKNNIDQEYILFTSTNFPTGGAGAAFLNLFCRGMALQDQIVKVYMTKGYAFGKTSKRIFRNNITPEGVPYTFMGFTKRPKIGFLKPFDDLLSMIRLLFILPSIAWKRKRITVFVYHTDFFHSLLIYLNAYIFKYRIVTFVPEYFNKQLFVGFTNRLKWYSFIFTIDHLNPLSSGLIVFSNFLQNIYLRKGMKKDCILVQPNLTDFDFWAPSNTDEKYTIGYSGTPGEKDGLAYLFKAMSLLKDQMEISLVLVGDSTFGKSMIPELEIVCEELGIRNQVHFAGLVEYSQVKTFLLQCKIVAITRPRTIQTQAGFPTKLGEYMALKKPVLATDFGEVETYFADGKEIVIANSGDPESIADKIKWMLENEEAIAIIADNGCKKARELLDYSTSIERIIKFIENVSV